MQPKFQKGEPCRACELERRGLGFVPADGPLGARLSFFAESPGPDEVIVGRNLIGAAGGTHTRILHRAGIARDLTRTANIIQCSPPGMWFDEKAPWYYPAISHCAVYRSQTLQAVPRDGVVVALGGTAMRTLMGLHQVRGVRVDEFHHTVNRSPDDHFWIVPTFHPSHLQRGAMSLLEVVSSAYRLADRIAREGFSRSPTTLVVDPAVEYVGGWIRDHLQRVRNDPDGVHLSLDTEFERKAADESATDVAATASSPLTRINLGNDKETGLTYPYAGPYIALTERLLAGLADLGGIVWTWFKYADWDHLRRAGHTLDGITCYDGAVAWHYLQSDLPMGLGFVAPLASDFGPWKHWSEDKDKAGPYAAADAVQNWRTCLWVFKALIASGQWTVFEQDWHERDQYVLRPSKDLGVPIDKEALETFHLELQGKYARILDRIKQVGAEGTLRPKDGYAKAPKGPPSKSILGSAGKKHPSEAKAAYQAENICLVERPVIRNVTVCRSCGAVGVLRTHKCRRPKGVRPGDVGLRADLRDERREVVRWFWQLPFNPSSWQQILAYIQGHGHQPGTSRKTRQPTTDKESLKKLAAETGDPLYQLLLDGRAVEKVDSNYAVGTLSRMDADDRIHPEITPRPSTLRDSSIGPNLQNVIADRSGPAGLAAGFRKCVVARDGVPPGTTEAEVAAWEERWR
jgi:uracil-DNA glycosylase family 4